MAETRDSEPDLWSAYDQAVERLLEALAEDDAQHGGLLSRDTIRRADETRLARSRLLTWMAAHE